MDHAAYNAYELKNIWGVLDWKLTGSLPETTGFPSHDASTSLLIKWGSQVVFGFNIEASVY